MAKILGPANHENEAIEPFDTTCKHCSTPYQCDVLSDIHAQFGTVQPYDTGVVYVNSICPVCKKKTPVPSAVKAKLEKLMSEKHLIEPEN